MNIDTIQSILIVVLGLINIVLILSVADLKDKTTKLTVVLASVLQGSIKVHTINLDDLKDEVEHIKPEKQM